jgi:hypothetical protein
MERSSSCSGTSLCSIRSTGNACGLLHSAFRNVRSSRSSPAYDRMLCSGTSPGFAFRRDAHTHHRRLSRFACDRMKRNDTPPSGPCGKVRHRKNGQSRRVPYSAGRLAYDAPLQKDEIPYRVYADDEKKVGGVSSPLGHQRWCGILPALSFQKKRSGGPQSFRGPRRTKCFALGVRR